MKENKFKTINETRARQGKKGTPVLYVLIGSFVLIMVVWGVVELIA